MDTFGSAIILAENLVKQDIFAVFLLASSALCAIFYGSQESQKYTVDCMLALFQRPKTLIVVGVTVFMIIVLACYLYKQYVHHKKKISGATSAQTSSEYPGVAYTQMQFQQQHQSGMYTTTTTAYMRPQFAQGQRREPYTPGKPSEESNSPKTTKGHTVRNWTPLAVALFLSLYGDIVGILYKAGCEVLMYTLIGNNQFHRWEGQLVFVLALLGQISVIYMFSKALSVFDAVVVLPMMNGIGLISGTYIFATAYNEFDSFTDIGRFAYLCGCVLALMGIVLVALRSESEDSKVPCLSRCQLKAAKRMKEAIKQRHSPEAADSARNSTPAVACGTAGPPSVFAPQFYAGSQAQVCVPAFTHVQHGMCANSAPIVYVAVPTTSQN